MDQQRNFIKRVIKKLVIGGVVGIALVIVAGLTHFPPVFQGMFFAYAMLGAFVFILLDKPPMTPVGGVKAIGSLVLFYIVISSVYIAGASFLPQFDPEDEKTKISKLLRAKRAATEKGKAEELLARAKTLTEKADAITKRLQAIGAGVDTQMAEQTESMVPVSIGEGNELVAQGREVYELYECYQCHKLFGKGGKKRGPKLDNIGSFMTAEQIREKVLDPKSWMAEGFEKQYKKGKMPDKYKTLMVDSELNALAAFLASLKNTSVDTPKPIKMN